MAKATWNGADEAVTFWGIAFHKGKPCEVTDPEVIARLKGNALFKVEDDEPGHARVSSATAAVAHAVVRRGKKAKDDED